MLKLSRTKKNACLALAVAATILGGGSVFASEHSHSIAESNNFGSNDRAYWKEQGVTDAKTNDSNTYTFAEDIVLKPNASTTDIKTWGGRFRGIFKAGSGESIIDMGGHSLTVDMNYDQPKTGIQSPAALKVDGIGVDTGTLTIKNVKGMNIKANGSWMTNSSTMYGIYVGGANSNGGWGDGDGQAVLNIENADDWDNAIRFHADESGDTQVVTGIYVWKNTGTSNLNISGLVDLDTGSAAAVTVQGGYNQDFQNAATTAYIGGGKFISSGPTAISVSGASLAINSKLEDGALVETAGNRDVQIEGDVVVKDAATRYNPKDDGSAVLALNTKDSYLNGTIYADASEWGQDSSGDVYVALKNGATWTNEAKGSNHGSKLVQFVGGDSSANTGYIFQKDSGALNLGSYSGYTTIFYEHDNAGTETSDYTAGNVTVKTAKAGSNITLVTDNVDTNNDATVKAALNALAGKLYYEGIKNGENALEGTAAIADGLTASSKYLKTSSIYFDEETGMGTTTVSGNQTKTEFTGTLTGDNDSDTEYKDGGVIAEDGSYKFDKATTISNVSSAISASKDATIVADKTLNLNVEGATGSGYGILLNGAKNVDIQAGALKMDLQGTGISSNGLQGVRVADGDAKLNINGNVDITVNGDNNTIGIYNRGNVTIDGDVKLNIEGNGGGYQYYGATGLYATSSMGSSKGGIITVNGNVDFNGNANGVWSNAGGSEVNVKGGSIIVKEGQTKGYAAIKAENGTINMNVVKDAEGNVTGADTNDVTIKGNLSLDTGAVNSVDIHGTKSEINLGLTTEKSSLTGVIQNSFKDGGTVSGGVTFTGAANLWLQNGATWNNEIVDTIIKAPWGGEKWNGSHVAKFVGSTSEATAGNIFQKDENNLTIDNYSGNTNIFYAHEGNGEAANDYAAGDTVIKSAAADSVVSLITDNTNVAMDNADSVANVLNALAGKLTYSNFTSGENNLTGYVKIADGLTASSKALKTGDVTFNKEDGKGTYVKKDIVEKSEFTTVLTGAADTDTEYEGNIDGEGNYFFTKDSTITVAGEDAAINVGTNKLTIKAGQSLNVAASGDASTIYGLSQKAGQNVVINAEKLSIDVTNTGRADAIHVAGNTTGERTKLQIKGDVELKATHDATKTAGDYTLGAYALQADLTIDGNVTSVIDSGKGNNQYYGATNIYAAGLTGTQDSDYQAGSITVNGNVDLSGKGQGIFANIGGAVVTVNGGGSIKVDKSAARDNGYAAIRSEDSTVNMNVKLDANGAATSGRGNDVNIEGNIAASVGAVNDIDTNGKMTTINLALDTANSTLHGALVNGFDRTDGTTGVTTLTDADGAGGNFFTGAINLYLQNGAEWNNELWGSLKFFSDDKYKTSFQGSHVANFTGGSDAAHTGYIIQNDDSDRNNLTIDNYSGYTTIFYSHTDNWNELDDADEADGTEANHYVGGNTIIKNAAKGSNITLVTDNANIDTDDTEQVTKVLNTLAGKLFYNAYITGERNLSGTVSIADGLTASKFTKTYNSGDIAFSTENGQGSYSETVQTEFTSQIQGTADRDTEYVNAGITTGDQKYTFTKDSTITVGNKDAILGVATIDDWDPITYIPVSTYKGITVDAGDKTLTLNTNQRGIYANGNSKSGIESNITAGKLVITANETNAYRDATFAVATGGVTLNVNADIEGTVYGTTSNSYGLYAEKGSTLNVDGNITAVKDNGYGIDGKDSNKTFGIRANNGTVTVNGDVDMTVNGTGINAMSNGTVNVNGLKLEVADGFSTMVANNGTINVNVNADKSAAGEKEVVLKGDIHAVNGGTVNLGMSTATSKLTGVVDGNVNLWLQNGASWDNNGASSVAKLAGGASEAAAGNIFANGALTIANYSGNTNIFYAHNGNGEATSDYTAGDTTITSAAEGSVVSLITDNTGISMDSEDSVANVLNALAGKLTYSNFATGEKNLTGYVKIADGLTASSKALKAENITFTENGQGSYEKPKPVQTEFASQIQGTADRDTEYVNAGITTGDQKYTFTKDSTITVGNKDAILGVATIDDWDPITYIPVSTYKGITVDAGDKTLTLNTNQRGIYANGNKSKSKATTTTDIKAGKLVINANEENAWTDAAFAVATDGAVLNIDADIEGTVYGTTMSSYGVLAEKESSLTVDGNITAAKDNGYGIDGKDSNKTFGIRANNGTVTVNGDVDMTVNGTGINAMSNGTVNVNGLKLEVADGFSTMVANNGTINVNVNADKSAAGEKEVVLKGDIHAVNGGTVNLGMSTATSKLTGVVDGNVNLWLQNGASWDNNGASSVAKLAGGASEAAAGNIFANGALTIANYSGNTNIFYAHTGNGEAASDYTAGDTTITSAAEGSVVSLITDNTGISMDSEDSVTNVLNALAGKLTYSNFATGEKNLTGYVKIADGLTASSKALKTGDITFTENGQGSYVVPIPDHQVVTEFKTTLTGDKDTDKEYLMGGVIAEDGTYKFTEASDITAVNAIDAAKDLKIVADKTLSVTADKGVALNVTNAAAKTVDITAEKLVLKTTSGSSAVTVGTYQSKATVNIKGDVDINATNNNSVYGILATNADITVTGDVKAAVDGGQGGYNYANVSAISAQGSSYRKYASTVTVNGDVDITANGNGLQANGNGATVTVNGGGIITINDSNSKGYSALRADNGTVNMNVAFADGKASAGLGKDVVLKGNLAATNGTGDAAASVINVALDTEKSSLEGVAYTAGNNSSINLWLQNGASWTNEIYGATEKDWQGNAIFTGSSIASFVGGTSDATAGNIFQKDSNNLTIANYSGNTNIFYAHTGNGEAASDYAAGDTIIKSAAEGSTVSLITDSTDVAMDNEYSVKNVLNALAGKLTYSNFVTGENNLTGYVKIADGLTASSKSMQAGDISFSKDDGKGSLKDGTLNPGIKYPDEQPEDKKDLSQGITGDAEKDYGFKQDGILKDNGNYVFTQDPTTIKVDEGAAVTATDKNINIDTTKAKLELKGADAGVKADGADVTIKGNTDISGNVGIDAANGNVALNGSSTISGTDAAINAGEGSNVDINTNNSILDIKGAINANGGNITVDSGKATSTINGDVSAANGGSVEINLNDAKSTLSGSYNVDADSSIVMNITNGAVWSLTDDEDEVASQSLMRMAKASATATGLTVNGGATQEQTGYLDMTKRSKDVNIASYSGWETFIYAHDNAGSSVEDYKNGNVIIDKAAAGSGVILSTDNTGIDMTSKDAVEATLKALAQKVTYSDHEANASNLTGKVQIADGLTASSASKNIGDMTWAADGKGQYKDDSVNWSAIASGEITEGDYETFVMKGVRSAATTSMHTWRDNMQDTYTGADLADADGIFAKALGGKTSSDVKGLKDSNTYYGVQVGYDKAAGAGWHTGVAFDYRNGDSNYLLGGKGDNQMYSLGVYGVKNFDNNSFFRVAAKVGRVENEYDVYNEIRSLKLHGDYKANAYGLTMEYGKTFGDEETYITPKAQLTWAQVGAKDYSAYTEKGARMDVDQDSYSSFVGRLGFEAGVKSEKGRLYAGLFAAHEFNGDIAASYFANDGQKKHTSFDGEDTWMEMKLGGTYDFSEVAHFYADIAKDFGGDFERKWKLNAGIRFEF